MNQIDKQKLESLRKDKDFEAKLKFLCNAYDDENGRWPESSLEGGALFSYYQGVDDWTEYWKELETKLGRNV